MQITGADLSRLDKEGVVAAQVIVQARQGRNVVRVRIPPGIDSKKVEARIQKELPGRVKRINMRGETLVVHLRNVN